MILAFLGIICSQVIVAQDMIRTHNLDSLLRTIKSPREKVDAILKFLKLPENPLY